MKKNVVRILTAMLMLSVVFSSSVFAAEKQQSAWDSFVGLFSGSATAAEDTQVDGVTYRTQIQNDGWLGWVADGTTSGSEGKGLRLEAIEIKIDDTKLPDGLGVTYRTQIENDGWLDWESDGDMSGSVGKGLRLEAIEIKLTGDNAGDYSVGYKTHIQNYGWEKDWSYNGDTSGTVGEGLRLEGIQIEIFKNIPDLTAYNAALAAVKEADYTTASWAAYQTVVKANVVTEDNLVSEVEDATAAITAAQANLVKVLKVESVSAINLNQIKVTFTQPVSKTTAENKANYTLNLGNGTNAKLDNAAWTEAPIITLQDDTKSVVITLDSNTNTTYQTLVNQVEATLTVADVKTADASQTLASIANKFSIVDTTVPTVTSVTMEGNKVIVVGFSEPVKGDKVSAIANYKINAVSLSSYGVSSISWDATKSTARINLTTGLADGEYTVTTSVGNAIEDFAGLKVMAVDTKVTLKADTTVATVTGVEVATDKSYVLVKFSKPLSPTSYATGAPLLIDGIDVIGSTTITDSVYNGYLKLVTTGAGTDYAKIIGAGSHAVNYTLDVTGNKWLLDAYGIKVGTSSTTYAIELDVTKPTVKTVTVQTGAATTEVLFSEAIDTATSQNRFNYTLKKADNTSVTISSAAIKAGTTDTVVLSHGALAAGTYTLAIQNVKDLANNTMDAYSTTLTVGDTTQPTVSSVKYSTAANSVYVYYSENMNATTTGTAANYMYKNAALPSGTVITALSQSAVKLTLPSTSAIASGDAFSVSNNVTDVAGNKLAGFGYNTTLATTLTNDLNLDSATTPNAKATAKDTVVLTLNKELKSLDASDLQIERAGGAGWATTVAQQDVSFVNTDGKAIVTIKVATMGTDAKDAGNAVKVRVKQTGTYATLATDDTTFVATALGSAAGTTISDKIAPELAATNPITTVDTNTDGQIDQVKIVFSEAMDGNFLSASTFDVSEYTEVSSLLDSSDATNKTVLVNLTPKTTPDTDATPNVTKLGVVKDANANEFAGMTTPTVSVDRAAPVLTKVETDIATVGTAGTATSKVRLTFSESITSAAATEFVLGTAPNTLTGSAITGSGNTYVVTVGTSAGTPAAGASLVFTRATAVDAAANAALNKTVTSASITYGVTL